MDGCMDGQTYGNSPLRSTGHRSFGATAQKATFTEPPMTLNLSDDKLRGLIEKPLFGQRPQRADVL